MPGFPGGAIRPESPCDDMLYRPLNFRHAAFSAGPDRSVDAVNDTLSMFQRVLT